MYKSLISISLIATVLTACGGGGSGSDASPASSSLSSSAASVVSSVVSSVVNSSVQSSAPSSAVTVSAVSSASSQVEQSSVPAVPSSVAASSLASAVQVSSAGVVQSSVASSEPAPVSSAISSEQSSLSISSQALSSQALSSQALSSEVSSSVAPSSEGVSSVAFSSALSSEAEFSSEPASSVSSVSSPSVSSTSVSSTPVSSVAQSSASAEAISSEAVISSSSEASAASEVSSVGESSVANSSLASSDGAGQVVIGWAPSADVFKVGGSSTSITGSVSASGADSTSFAITGGKFESNKEAFFFANQWVSGDFVFTANISSWGSGTRSGSDQGSIGLLLCDACDTTMASVPASAKIGVRDNGIIHTERLSSGAGLTKTSIANSVSPSNQLYLRITRTGNQVALAYSNDGGVNYDTVRTASFTALSSSVRIGIYAAQGTEASNNVVASNIRLLAGDQVNTSSSLANSSSSSSPASSAGQVSSSSQGGGQSSVGNSSHSSQGQSSSSAPYVPVDVALSNACINLVTNPSINWRDTELQSDQDIVKCLHDSLGSPVGYGENANGGYDPNGNSKLTVITKNSSVSVEQQLIDALTDNNHNWVVFDKLDFASESEIGLYRTYCSNPTVLTMLDASETECVNYWQWCERKGFSGEAKCREEFFNKQMNNKDIPIRIPAVGSNKTLDGRMSKAYFMFSGFAIGRDSAGVSTQKSTSVIFTYLDFRGAGHTEDHYVDPDMIRSTGESQDIWIHKNTFDTTGDSAFDVKVGARNITMSFNRLVNVKRAVLHGSSDSRVINAQITTTMHHNAFVTTDDSYTLLGNGLRRVPLLRRGTTHMTNNVFINYRKEVLSLRVGAKAWLQDNAFVINRSHQEKSSLEASLSEIQGNLFKDISGGSLRNDGNSFWFFTGDCVLDMPTQMLLTATSGAVDDLLQSYSTASRNTMAAWHFDAGQGLVDYVSATAGKYGLQPFNAALSPDRVYMEGLARGSCQP